VRCGPFCRDRSAQGHILVSLPELSKAYRRPGFCLRGIRLRSLYRYQRRDNQVRYYARENAARILRPVRVNFDLRKSPWADGNAFSCRCVRSSRAASAKETVFSRGTPAVVTHRRGIRPVGLSPEPDDAPGLGAALGCSVDRPVPAGPGDKRLRHDKSVHRGPRASGSTHRTRSNSR